MTTLKEISQIQNASRESFPELPTLKRAEDLLELDDPLQYMPYYWAKDRSTYKKEFGSPRQSPLGPEGQKWLKQLSNTQHPGNVKDLYQFAPFFPCYSSFTSWLLSNEFKWANLADTFQYFLDNIATHPAFVWNATSIKSGVISTSASAARLDFEEGEYKEGDSKLLYTLDSWKNVGYLSNTLGSKMLNMLGTPGINEAGSTLVRNSTAFNIFDKVDFPRIEETRFPWAEAGMTVAERKVVISDLKEWLGKAITTLTEEGPDTFFLSPDKDSVGSKTGSKNKPKVNWDHLIMDI